MVWSSVKIQQCWENICRLLPEVLRITVRSDLVICLLGAYTEFGVMPNSRYRFLHMALIAAKRCIVMRWKQEDSHTVSKWIQEVIAHTPLEKTTYTI